MQIRHFAAVVIVLATAMAGPAYARTDVGHRVESLVVEGSTSKESRQVTVHLWYPAGRHAFRRAADTVYTSSLHGKTLVPERWDPLSWQVDAEIARDTAAVEVHRKPLPVIVFSHGSTNDPIDYAHTLERIAAKGFVVAAPYHVNNTQDDARMDFINGMVEPDLFACLDGRPAPCSRSVVPRSMEDRGRDITAILDELPDWFGDRVDAKRAGVLGHSRGTVTALAAAGGSTTWGFGPERRVKAVMGMAIGVPAITNGVDLTAVTVPAVLVAGGNDTNSEQIVSESAFRTINSADKLFVGLPMATHRTFDSTYCAQLQSAGAAFDTDHDNVVEPEELTNTRPILDRHTVSLIAASAPGFISGKAVHYCARAYFKRPVDIEQLVAATFNAEYACDGDSCAIAPPAVPPPPPRAVCVTTSVPCTGLDTDEVKEGMADIAGAFFRNALVREKGVRSSRWLSPKWLLKHVPMVGSACAVAGGDPVYPPCPG